ncbi:toxin-antitoxin system HicB family antitoxin [Sorangium sp. So ce118]
MSTLSLRLPESIHRKLSELAEREGVSMNQLISSAVAEKLAAIMTEEYLHERGRRASAEMFDAVLAKIPDAPPVQGDEIPEGYRKRTKKRRTG